MKIENADRLSERAGSDLLMMVYLVLDARVVITNIPEMCGKRENRINVPENTHISKAHFEKKKSLLKSILRPSISG
jgi:hypothetical protein